MDEMDEIDKVKALLLSKQYVSESEIIIARKELKTHVTEECSNFSLDKENLIDLGFNDQSVENPMEILLDHNLHHIDTLGIEELLFLKHFMDKLPKIKIACEEDMFTYECCSFIFDMNNNIVIIYPRP